MTTKTTNDCPICTLMHRIDGLEASMSIGPIPAKARFWDDLEEAHEELDALCEAIGDDNPCDECRDREVWNAADGDSEPSWA